MRFLLVSLLCVIPVCLSSAFAQSALSSDPFDQLPNLGSSSEKYLSEYEAKKLGNAFIRNTRYRLPYISDPELLEYINSIGDLLLSHSSDANKNYHFYLIDNDVINAFAVPGGHIALHTAILTKSESESELASVLAHEISHVTQRHIARRFENSRFDTLFALGALLAAAVAGGDAAQAAFGVANAEIINRKLSYSRTFESEADSLGIRLLSKAKFDVTAMSVFFQRLLDESRINESHAPEFLRSHPLTINRVTKSIERVSAYPNYKPDSSLNFLMMQAKAKVKYAKDKAQILSYYKDKVDNYDASLPHSYGYATALTENHQYDAARAIFVQLRNQYPDNISVRLAAADNELEGKNIDEGLAILKSTYEESISKNNHLIDLYYANALVLTQRHQQAIPILKSAIAVNKTEPYAHILLSRSYGETGQEMHSYLQRGIFHYLRGNYQFAITQYIKAESFAKTDYDKARISAYKSEAEQSYEQIKKL